MEAIIERVFVAPGLLAEILSGIDEFMKILALHWFIKEKATRQNWGKLAKKKNIFFVLYKIQKKYMKILACEIDTWVTLAHQLDNIKFHLRQN